MLNKNPPSPWWMTAFVWSKGSCSKSGDPIVICLWECKNVMANVCKYLCWEILFVWSVSPKPPYTSSPSTSSPTTDSVITQLLNHMCWFVLGLCHTFFFRNQNWRCSNSYFAKNWHFLLLHQITEETGKKVWMLQPGNLLKFGVKYKRQKHLQMFDE